MGRNGIRTIAAGARRRRIARDRYRGARRARPRAGAGGSGGADAGDAPLADRAHRVRRKGEPELRSLLRRVPGRRQRPEPVDHRPVLPQVESLRRRHVHDAGRPRSDAPGRQPRQLDLLRGAITTARWTGSATRRAPSCPPPARTSPTRRCGPATSPTTGPTRRSTGSATGCSPPGAARASRTTCSRSRRRPVGTAPCSVAARSTATRMTRRVARTRGGATTAPARPCR